MNQQEFEADCKARLARELALGRIAEEIKRAEAELDAAPATVIGTERMLAHSNLHFWLAKQLIVERGIYL